MTPAAILAQLDSGADPDGDLGGSDREMCTAAAALIRAQQKRIEELEEQRDEYYSRLRDIGGLRGLP